MTNQALTTTPAARPPAIRSERARKYARASKADRTLYIYGRCWAEFEAYAQAQNVPALPASPELLIDYLTDMADAGGSVSTIDVKRSAIVYMHRFNHLPDPTANEEVKMVMLGIRHTIGVAPRQMDPIVTSDLSRIVRVIPADLRGKRDRALILLGFAGAFRSAELVALTMADVAIGSALRVTVRKSKTDQNRAGFVKVIPLDLPEALDPVTALTDYLDEADITTGPIFRRCKRNGALSKKRLDKQSVTLIIRRHAQRAGLDAKRFTGHSLRAGFSTSAINNGANSFDTMDITGHKSEWMLKRYVRNAGQGAQSAVRAAFKE